MTETPSSAAVGLKGLCPRCGARTLFAGLVGFAPSCRACGLDFSAFNVGDGPAAFLTFGVGGLVTAGAITLELAGHPPFWLHILIWPPVTALAVIGALRFSKGWLVAQEYRNRAAEARIRRP